LTSPYECDPSDNNVPCKVFFKKDQSFEVPCKCALDNAGKGYCGNILGTPEYKDALYAMKEMVFTNRCHTLDRHNDASKFDTCASVDTSVLKAAVEKFFGIQYWPYM